MGPPLSHISHDRISSHGPGRVMSSRNGEGPGASTLMWRDAVIPRAPSATRRPDILSAPGVTISFPRERRGFSVSEIFLSSCAMPGCIAHGVSCCCFPKHKPSCSRSHRRLCHEACRVGNSPDRLVASDRDPRCPLLPPCQNAPSLAACFES